MLVVKYSNALHSTLLHVTVLSAMLSMLWHSSRLAQVFLRLLPGVEGHDLCPPQWDRFLCSRMMVGQTRQSDLLSCDPRLWTHHRFLRCPRSPTTSLTKRMFEFVKVLARNTPQDEIFNMGCNQNIRGSRSICGERPSGRICSRPSSVPVRNRSTESHQLRGAFLSPYSALAIHTAEPRGTFIARAISPNAPAPTGSES